MRKALHPFILLVFLTTFLVGFAQNNSSDKIDPVLRALIAQKNVPDSLRKLPTHFLILPTEGYVSRNAAPEKRYNVIVYTKNAKALRDSGIILNSVLPGFVTAWVTIDQISKLALMPEVTFIESPSFDYLHNDVEVGTSGASLLHNGRLNNTVYKGKNVIVAIFDTGIDWDHPDFRDPVDQTKSRIIRLWDQTLTPIAGEVSPSGFAYGVEYTQAQINNEIDGSPAGFVREQDIDGHGTHVAGTAAGNGAALPTKRYGGMAPEADIIIIKGGNGSFSTSNIIDGITYLQGLANTLGRPIVMNMSLGGQFGPHDGTRSYEVAVDNFTSSGTGRVVVISAGNDNGTNIHNRYTLGGAALNTTSFSVPTATTGTDIFEYRVYSNDNSAVSATVTAPAGGGGGTVTANAGQSVSGNVLGGNFTVFITNAIDAGDNDRYVDVYVQRNGANTATPVGTWTLDITNNTGNTLTMDGWLYYKNAVFNTTLTGGDNNFLVGSPGNATSAITAASYVAKLGWFSVASPGAGGYAYSPPAQQDNISTFSSVGPRRDGVLKPELAANGQAVISCLSSDAGVPASSTNLVVSGLYQVEQGTSMASPAIAGAVALLLQAKPTATAAEIKTLLTNAATKDVMTETPGATPNSTWGYGKLNVFRAAAAIFNCASNNWKTFQYDNSYTSSTDGGGITLTTQRIAVRFTPDIFGKLGGIFFHPSLSTTDLVVEVRTNNAGNPGTLLGTLNLPSANNGINLFSWNYADLSSLNISIAPSTDYFVILMRDAGSSANWSIRRDNAVVDNRSLLSTDGGVTWTNPGVDYRIRSVVYHNGQLGGALALVNATDTRDINTSQQFRDASCGLIAQLAPNGGSPVSGTVTGRVWIESSVPHYGGPFVARHFQITPAANPGTSTGRVTLYFRQTEFDAFNADPGSTLDLPANPTDAVGKANLRVAKYAGNSGDNTGMPASYGVVPQIIDPNDVDIVWNAEAVRWEVTFDVTTGFSGFIVQTLATPLPVTVEFFRGSKQGTSNVLNWKINCDNSAIRMDVERSADGSAFNSIGSISATSNRCLQPFDFTDARPMPGKNYYRIKITEITGSVHYTNIILLQMDALLTNTLFPTIIPKGGSVQVSYVAGTKGSLVISDATGRQVYVHSLTNGSQIFSLPLRTAGIYFYNIKDDIGNNVSNGKIVIRE